jgi:hypothetical protein
MLGGRIWVEEGNHFGFELASTESVHGVNPNSLVLNGEPPQTCQTVYVHDEEEEQFKQFENQFYILV